MGTSLFFAVFVLSGGVCLGGRLNKTLEVQDEQRCKYAGLQCSSCNRLSLCIPTGEGLIEFYTEDCNADAGEYCNTFLTKCSARKSYCSVNALFECQNPGVFPDPFDCNKYYVCSKSEDGGLHVERATCPTDSAFNVRTLECDITDDDKVCDGYPVPECPESGQTAAPLPQNPNLYYVCDNGVPSLFRCVDGADYVYDRSLRSCANYGPYEDCVPGKYQPVPHTYRNGYMCDEYMPMTRGRVTCPKYFDRETRDCGYGENPYPDEWYKACPTKEVDRPVPKTCNLYYKCSSGIEDVKSCPNYFDRKEGVCKTGKCPYDEDSL